MQYFDFEIMGLKRKLPFVKVGEHLALASFVVLSDTELIQTVAPELMKRLPEVDVLMTAEAKGICLTYELSRLMGMKDFVVARKSRKPYMQNAISHPRYSLMHSICSRMILYCGLSCSASPTSKSPTFFFFRFNPAILQ